MSVYDIHLSKLVEKTGYDGLSLMSPTLNMTTNASITYADSVSDVAHSLRVYKGKIFALVCSDHIQICKDSRQSIHAVS